MSDQLTPKQIAAVEAALDALSQTPDAEVFLAASGIAKKYGLGVPDTLSEAALYVTTYACLTLGAPADEAV